MLSILSISATVQHDNIPGWVAIPVLLLTGLYFLGKYEGWFKKDD